MIVDTAAKPRIQRSPSCFSFAPLGHELAQLLDDLELSPVLGAGERLAPIKLLAVPVESAMLVGRKRRFTAELPVSRRDV